MGLFLCAALAFLGVEAIAVITNNTVEHISIEHAVADFRSAPETPDAPEPATSCSDISIDLVPDPGQQSPVPAELTEVSLRGTRLAAFDGEVRIDSDPVTPAVLDGLLLNPPAFNELAGEFLRAKHMTLRIGTEDIRDVGENFQDDFANNMAGGYWPYRGQGIAVRSNVGPFPTEDQIKAKAHVLRHEVAHALSDALRIDTTAQGAFTDYEHIDGDHGHVPTAVQAALDAGAAEELQAKGYTTFFEEDGSQRTPEDYGPQEVWAEAEAAWSGALALPATDRAQAIAVAVLGVDRAVGKANIGADLDHLMFNTLSCVVQLTD